MFQSESLQEKWKPLLNYEGLDEIKDPHRKAVTAVLLENQEKFLREESSFSSNGMLMEQPTVKSDTISEGVDSADAPDVSNAMAAYMKTISAFKQS